MVPIRKIFSLPREVRVVLFYKLAAELLLLVLLGSSFFFLVEMIVPGFVSSRINFSTPYLILILCLAPLFFLKPQQEKSASGAFLWPHRSFLFFALVSLFMTLMLGNDMHGLSLGKSLFILFLVFLAVFFLLSFLFRERKNS